MENDLMLDVQQIVVRQGSIDFNDFENILVQAQKLAEEIETVEVNEENIKQSKKLLAAVNKRLKELEDRRIAIKNTMLEPYKVFEDQVKEIVNLVKEADSKVRDQVKYLEEFERLEKEEQIKELFEKRMKHYSFRNLFGLKDFLKPKHLNKTTSIKAVEDEIVDFLSKLATDLKVIEAMPNAEAVLGAYIDVKDLAKALNTINEQEAKKQAIKASQALQPSEDKIAYLVSVKCYNDKELKFLEILLKQNGFEFITDKILGGK